MALNVQELQAMLHDILSKTCDGDHRAIAQDYIVQLSIRNMNAKERAACEKFINKAMAAIDAMVKEVSTDEVLED